MNVVVVGAGIGGLAAAIALAQAGHAVKVFERTPDLREVGAGLALWPNATRALRCLGVGDAVDALAIPQLGGGIHTWDGELLVNQSGEALRERYGMPTIVAHRAELQRVLAVALPRDCLRFDTEFQRFEQDERGVTAYLGNGAVERAEVLIGADGIHSALRRQLFPASQPRYSGYTAWRGVAPFAHAPTDMFWGESWGVGVRFGLAPLSHDRAYWFCTQNAAEADGIPPERRKAHLLELFRGWHHPIGTLIERTPDDAILQNDIYDIAPLRAWTRGRVALLGDAAHAMTPNLGQGACQALEDAVELGKALHGVNDAAAALFAYETQRMTRANAILIQSRRIGAAGQWSNPFACAVRNRLVKWTASLQVRQIDSVIGTAPMSGAAS